jgi:hypothetical protein
LRQHRRQLQRRQRSRCISRRFSARRRKDAALLNKWGGDRVRLCYNPGGIAEQVRSAMCILQTLSIFSDERQKTKSDSSFVFRPWS